MTKKENRGFSLIEVVFAVAVLAFVIISMIKVYIYMSVQSELAGNKTVALMLAQNKIEEIRDYSYDLIVADYASGGAVGNTFNLTRLTGAGAIYIDSSNADLLIIKVVVCWQDKYERIIGEDADLDGVLDVGEDQDSNGEISSPITVVSMITKR
ncbi:MAG: prepilin-type N-terminal cleavage/methylation domain-containing protein [Candidatus Omnitrophica bacterium]|nr:prepilin-type N-terminal cleavage/methylation domain-containing protein [Candidatus Omnitrophota bacterium]